MVKTGQTWSGLVVTKDSTGALATPTVGPAGVLYVDGTANGASVTISGSNPYKWTCVLPTLTAGQCVSMYVTATIATIATASVVAEDVADTVRLSDVPAVNVTLWKGATAPDAPPTAAAVADAVWDAARSGHAGAGTFGATDEWAGSVDEAAIAAAVLGAADSDPISANVVKQAGEELAEPQAGYPLVIPVVNTMVLP